MYNPDPDEENANFENDEILSNEKISDIDMSNEDLDLEHLQALMSQKKPQIYTNEKPYAFTKDKERADVYIKNYLMKFDMEKSLKILEQEFFELLSKGEIHIEEIPNVPPVYIQSEIYQENIGNIQKELDDAKIYAEKANSLFIRLSRAKENEKIRHRRVQQEKKLLIKDIDKMKKVYNQDNDIYAELKKKYWDLINETMALERDLKSTHSKVDNMKDTQDRLKKTVDDLKKQKESK